MKKSAEDILQERLEQLESGASLENSLADLPEEEASLLKLVAAVRALPYPRRQAEAVPAQRSKLLDSFERSKTMSPTPRPSSPAGQPHRKRQLWLVLVGAAALIGLACLFWLVVGGALGAQALTGNSPAGQIFAPHPPNAQSAVLSHVRGLVEVKDGSGAWAAARDGKVVAAGQTIRTRALSTADLTLYDGSVIHFKPETVLSIDQLDTGGWFSPRLVLLSQREGQTTHDVTPSSKTGARYEVSTPSGVASVKGTSFTILIFAQVTRVYVEKGEVAVTNVNVTVMVLAGQSTLVRPSQHPSTPAFLISGQGVVTQAGGTWMIGGQSFRTDNLTAISGSPQVGDTVSVQGRILSSGARFADVIILIQRSADNRFSFSGKVDALSGSSITVAGQTAALDSHTRIDAGIKVGDTVSVAGVVRQGGGLLAEEVSLIDQSSGQPFSFAGVAQGTGATWSISGVSVKTDEHTEIEGGIAVGDLVEVSGWILPDGTWLAGSIEKADEDEREFHISGPVQGMSPWSVAGASFQTNDQTRIDAGIKVGDLVSVSGVVLEDGTWLAGEISLIQPETARFEFVSTVTGTAPLAVSGFSFTTDSNTQMPGDLAVGDLVKVEGRILPDGTWLAEEITKLEPDEDLGCMDSTATVQSISAGQIVLLSGAKVDEDQDTKVEGQIQVASIVLIRACTDRDGHVTIISIIVIYQLDALPTPRPQQNGGHEGDDEHDDD